MNIAKAAAEARLAQARRELGSEVLNGFANEMLNSTESEIDEEGSLWICSPQSGHWADAEKLEEFIEWMAAQ